jgi:hypothetical protein
LLGGAATATATATDPLAAATDLVVLGRLR